MDDRVRGICLALPGVEERLSHGTPAYFVRRQFVMVWPDGHHDHHFANLWCAAPPGAQDELVTSEPDRFFTPPYVGGRGWIGVRLDGQVDWEEIAAICEEAYRTVAPKQLVAALDAARGGPPLPASRVERPSPVIRQGPIRQDSGGSRW